MVWSKRNRVGGDGALMDRCFRQRVAKLVCRTDCVEERAAVAMASQARRHEDSKPWSEASWTSLRATSAFSGPPLDEISVPWESPLSELTPNEVNKNLALIFPLLIENQFQFSNLILLTLKRPTLHRKCPILVLCTILISNFFKNQYFMFLLNECICYLLIFKFSNF